ncbi:uncharacterized protein MICPUCDRAFT_50034 [Micromonas pusilla CCMP1545]|uniref:Predicted protein n=1 Tax=Micromonas pusilla (strain CCMP1545) TaxID=564608 RepID=C1MH33_MICPC|nr:uncharacterized protein MICPUCDRAFT_50034 [Micromonas pusilla CCMP1545]EEH60134.1 predicted protein [Micromonas pusilla CCMP1545]|eukprot:XP_003054882.1 predicted protein [Micromonas pusilla CCMP1545]
MQRGPLTRRQHLLARNRSENERASRLLSLSDDVLGHVCSFLDGRDLARLETVCTHFKHRSWVAVNEASLPEQSAKRKLDAMTLGEMPPGFRYALSLSGRFYRQISREHRRRTRARARARRVLARGFDDANRVSIARKTRSRVRLARVGSSLAPSPLPDASLGFSEDTVRVQVSVRAASPDAARFFFCSFETAQEDEVHAQAVRRRAAGDPADARERDDRHVGPREEGRGIGEEDDYAVGWEQGMDDTVGKPFPVGVVSKAYRQSPVVGLSVPNGLVAIAGGRYPTYGWYYPLEALEHV